MEGVEHSQLTIVLDVGQCCNWMAGENGHFYWCLMEKLPQKLHFPYIPKYADADAIAYSEARLDKPVLSGATNSKFSDLWEKILAYALVNTEGNLRK